jgi:hypothetical protein
VAKAPRGARRSRERLRAPTYGTLRLVVTRNLSRQPRVHIVTNELGADLTSVVKRKMSRWSIETIFRDTPSSLGGWKRASGWVDQAMVRHVALVLVAFVVSCRSMRWNPDERVGVRSRSAGS